MASPLSTTAPPSATASTSTSADATTSPQLSRRDRPCDACRKRKSRCVINSSELSCVLCQFHGRDCTFVEEPKARKRKATELHSGQSEKQMRVLVTNTGPGIEEYEDLPGPSLLKKTLGLRNKQHSRYIGPTHPLIPQAFENIQESDSEVTLPLGTLRRVGVCDLFLMISDTNTQSYSDELKNLDEIEAVVVPYGQALVTLYFRIVHPSWPILHKEVFLEKYARSYKEFSSPLLAVVYLLALNYWSYDNSLNTATKPDSDKLAALAKKSLMSSIHRPKLSTVQAGLLLLQHTEQDPAELTAQLVHIGHGLGLHLDCSNWAIPNWETGLRVRLGWALFLQDQFSSLTTGKPPLINSCNWGLRSLESSDFPENSAHENDQEGSAEVEQGRILFTHMVGLATILSELLESLFTIRVSREIAQAGDAGLTMILEKAKPIQLKLREWFTNLPLCLDLDNTSILKFSSVGLLRLAYLVVEITLHRRIILALSPTTPPQLLQICRAAAKERFLSAIDFAQSLKPQHIHSFWYFATADHFSSIATFGILLHTTANDLETEFFKSKLREYRWILKINTEHGCKFMKSAVNILDFHLNL